MLKQLVLVFSDQKSPVFPHSVEQLIIEATMKNTWNWYEWIVPGTNLYEHEREVYITFSMSVFKNLVSKAKELSARCR